MGPQGNAFTGKNVYPIRDTNVNPRILDSLWGILPKGGQDDEKKDIACDGQNLQSGTPRRPQERLEAKIFP
jgi:hypothetical protein